MVGEHPRREASFDEVKRNLADLLPPVHTGEPEDTGWEIARGASGESKSMTGAELVIDGGYTARWRGREPR